MGVTLNCIMEFGAVETKVRRKCVTDQRKHANREELAVDFSNGFVPLWQKGTNLTYAFDLASFRGIFGSQTWKTIAAVQELFEQAQQKWEFTDYVTIEQVDSIFKADFIVHAAPTNGNMSSGFVLASAFFPNADQNDFYVYPEMFTLGDPLNTMLHEIGHIYGLRHYFFREEEGFPGLTFGTENEKTIMNYGKNSIFTDTDKKDLKALYEFVGDSSREKGVPIVLFKSRHELIQGLNENKTFVIDFKTM